MSDDDELSVGGGAETPGPSGEVASEQRTPVASEEGLVASLTNPASAHLPQKRPR